MLAENVEVSPTADREIVVTRLFDAPPKMVFEAWSSPESVSAWWGPRGFTTSFKKFELKTGGVWDYVMHGPDGTDYPNFNRYEEVIPGERLVYTHGATADDGGMFHVTVTFELVGRKTRVTMRSLFPTAEARAQVVRDHGAIEGGKQTFDRLGQKLAEMSAREGELVIARTFNAPRDLVFKAWSEAEHLAEWWGPKGFSMGVTKLDFRPGGTFHYSMRSPDGQEMWGKFVYEEIAAPERIVYISSFSDAEGKVTRHPMAPTWPLETRSELTFSEDDGRTLLVLRGGPQHATEEERKTFEGALKNVQGGFKGTFDQLEEYLAKVK